MCDVARRTTATVYKSLSKCIYQNLAFEEFLFRKHSVETGGDVLFVWSNKPAVVVGKHQNTWVEVNIPYVQQQGIDIARRHSGGGTVYHDLGNINISILTTHKNHCRPKNLGFLSEALNRRFALNIVPNKRDDMEMQPGDRKCSGTAARISGGKAYHHMTLLVKADLERLRRSLRSPFKKHISSNATASVSANAVGFLQQDDKKADIEDVRTTLCQAFADRYETCIEHIVDVESEMMGHYEIVEYYQQLRQWDWVFGKTPKFTYSMGKTQLEVEKGLVKSTGDRFAPKSLDL